MRQTKRMVEKVTKRLPPLSPWEVDPPPADTASRQQNNSLPPQAAPQPPAASEPVDPDSPWYIPPKEQLAPPEATPPTPPAAPRPVAAPQPTPPQRMASQAAPQRAEPRPTPPTASQRTAAARPGMGQPPRSTLSHPPQGSNGYSARVPVARRRIAPAPKRRRSLGAAIWRGISIGLFTVLLLAVLGMAGGFGIYAYYASSLPSPEELYQRTTPFKSTKIYDRNGKLLFEIFDPTAGRRTVVRYNDIPEVMINAVVATEDSTFFSNPGFNPWSIARSFYQNLRDDSGQVYGGSTITQQLVKNLFLTREQTLSRKIKEAILAAEITRRYSKQEILEVYLNEVYFGNLSYGIGAASESYFGKHVSQLSLHEAALLAGLLQSPAIYDPYLDPQAALGRRETVLRLMRNKGYISQADYDAAVNQPLGVIPQKITIEAPHMVMYVRGELERLYGTEMLYKGGLQVYTTLDLDMQHLAEQIAQEKIAVLREQKATNTALIAMDPRNGDVLAMLGSADFYNNEIDGQVNVAIRPRQPGSAIKPLTYLAAMERGWTAATMLMDVAQEFPDGANPPYKPTNYDNKEWGPISVRTSLANSRNITAVSTLHQIGLPALLEMAQRLGIHSLTRPDYGLSLTLGGGEVTLLEMTGAYGALANGGRRVTPRVILEIKDQDGNVVLGQTPPDMPQVVDPRLAYIITHILADKEARVPTFGRNNVLELSVPAAAKTGTTNDYRDSWTVGYTPELVTGVWVGNSDNTPMDRVAGSRGAGIIWHDLMERTVGTRPPQEFVRPEGIVEAEVCPVSGMKRTELCPPGRKEIFPADNVPSKDCPVHKRVAIDKTTGKLATEFCPPENIEQRVVEDYGAEFDAWAQGRGITTPPRETCPVHTARTNVALNLPGQPLSGIVDLYGSTEMGDFAYYALEYGVGSDPQGWGRLTPEITSPVINGPLLRWDTRTLEDGTYTLRLIVADRKGNRLEARGVVQIANATPTPPSSPTPTMTATPLATETLPPTPTLAPTEAPTLQPTLGPTSTPVATRPPILRASPQPTQPAEATAEPLPTETPTSQPTAAQGAGNAAPQEAAELTATATP